MSERSLRKLRGIYSDALRAASLSGEFIALGQANTPFSVIGEWSVSLKGRSRYCPAIVQALGLLSSIALSSCATVRLSARRDGNQPRGAPYLSSSICTVISIVAV
jgi:hypothetical protein